MSNEDAVNVGNSREKNPFDLDSLDQETREFLEAGLNKIDREVLRNIAERTEITRDNMPLHGREFDFEDGDREQLLNVAQTAQLTLEKIKSSTDWSELQKLIREGSDKGIIIKGFKFPPYWLIDGGDNAEVKKVRRENNTAKDPTKAPKLPGIEVSTKIYNAYIWDVLSKNLENVAQESDESLYGKSTEQLNDLVKRFSYYFKVMGLVDD